MPIARIPEHVYISVELYEKNSTRYDPQANQIKSIIYPFQEGIDKAAQMTDAMVYSAGHMEIPIIAIDVGTSVIHVRASDVKFVVVHYVPAKKN